MSMRIMLASNSYHSNHVWFISLLIFPLWKKSKRAVTYTLHYHSPGQGALASFSYWVNVFFSLSVLVLEVSSLPHSPGPLTVCKAEITRGADLLPHPLLSYISSFLSSSSIFSSRSNHTHHQLSLFLSQTFHVRHYPRKCACCRSILPTTNIRHVLLESESVVYHYSEVLD